MPAPHHSVSYRLDALPATQPTASHSTQNRSFRRRFSKPVSWPGMEKTKPNTTKARIHQSKEMYYNTNKLKPGLVAFYNMQPGNGASLFSKKEITKRGDE